MNSIKKNFSKSGFYLFEILITDLILIASAYFFLEIESHEVRILIILLFASNLVFLFLVGRRRNSELENIKKIIKDIRENAFLSADEIKLSRYLGDLEDEIKSMFIRTQNDIENLKKLEQVRTEFLGNVSHELRTPIFAIQGFIETLLEGAINDPKVNMNFLQKANQHTLNLNALLNDLIDISMIESGQMQLSFRYFNITDFLKNVITEMQPHAAKKNLGLALFSPNPSLSIYGDRERLKQVMTNLIINAVKYTEAGRIEIEVIEEAQSAKIAVRDTGIGIADGEIKRIFERFYRIDKGRSRHVGGTGLGLAIVKHIIEAHNSKIEVVSQIGKGSEFSFKLRK